MTDYTDILPDNDRDLQRILSSCSGTSDHTPYDFAYLQIDDDDNE